MSMFFTSFLPLWITILFINIKSIVLNYENLYTEKIGILLILLATIVSVTILFSSKKVLKESDFTDYTIISTNPKNGVTSEYLLFYILPLFSFDFTVWDSVVQFVFCFLVLSFLCVRNNNVYANILFELLGYKFFDCEVKDLSELEEEKAETIRIIVISKDSSLPSQGGNSISIAPLNKPFYLVRSDRS